MIFNAGSELWGEACFSHGCICFLVYSQTEDQKASSPRAKINLGGLTQSTPAMSFIAINPLTLECWGRALRNKGSKAALLITDRQLRRLETWDQDELVTQGSGKLHMAEGVLSAHPPPVFSSAQGFYNEGSREWLAKHSMMVLGGLSEPRLLLVSCSCVYVEPQRTSVLKHVLKM